MKNKLAFSGEVWLYPGTSGNWHFISLPGNDSTKIKETFGLHVRGWGSIRVEAHIGKTKWKTSIFPDKKEGAYILPIKASVRKDENIRAGDIIKIKLAIMSGNYISRNRVF